MSLLLSAQREAEEPARKRLCQGQPTPWKTSVGEQHKPENSHVLIHMEHRRVSKGSGGMREALLYLSGKHH